MAGILGSRSRSRRRLCSSSLVSVCALLLPLCLDAATGVAGERTSAAARVAAAPTGAKKQAVESSTKGAIVMLPMPGVAPSDLTTTLLALKKRGYSIPSNQLEFTDVQEILKELEGDTIRLGGEPGVACESGKDSSDASATLAQRVADVEKALLIGEFEAAEKTGAAAEALVPCLTRMVDADLLYKTWFLRGVTHFFRKQPTQALEAFGVAVAANPDKEWERNYPPGAWELFLTAQKKQLNLPNVLIRQGFVASGARALVNGREVPAEGLSVKPGLHLFQVQANSRAPVETRLVDLSRETGEDTVWLAPISRFQDWNAVLGTDTTVDPVSEAATRALLVRRARKTQRDWMLLVRPETTGGEIQVQYLDVKTGTLTEPPPTLWDPKAGSTVTLPGVPGQPPKERKVPGFLKGWHVAVGPHIVRPLTGSVNATWLEFELGGFRPIAGNLDARVALGVGQAGVLTHLGVRQNFNLAPFALFVEGGLLGRATGVANEGSLGLEVRGGTSYYFMDPLKQNGLEVTLGLGVLFSPLVVGSVGLSYHRGF